MVVEPVLALPGPASWRVAIMHLLCAWLALFAVTLPEWREMAHQWWDIDTYSHILLIPPIIGWLAWIRREELRKLAPSGWGPGLALVLAGLAACALGRSLDINLMAQTGAVVALQASVATILGLRAALILAFPLLYAFALVPFGDEIIPPLQLITAEIATALTRWSGIDTVASGINIDTPAGLFIVAEECSGVKFLIAMIALGVLVAHARFSSWRRRGWFLLACITVPILANGVRAWATIFIAQHIGAEAAGSFDHLVYGWIFFAIVIAVVLGVAWRWFEREPEAAGWTTQEIAAMSLVKRWEGPTLAANIVLAAIFFAAASFAVVLHLG